MTRYIILLALIINSFMLMAFDINKIKTGDLILADLGCGELCQAIKKVTPTYNGKNWSHIGIAKLENDSLFIIEAIGKEVTKTPFHTFYARIDNSDNKILALRLIDSYSLIIDKAIQYSESKIGVAYDDSFRFDNDKLYCSELVYLAFKYANNGKDVFLPKPMTFIDPDTKETSKAWIDYYQSLGESVPEGEIGINPGGIANSNLLYIVN